MGCDCGEKVCRRVLLAVEDDVGAEGPDCGAAFPTVSAVLVLRGAGGAGWGFAA